MGLVLLGLFMIGIGIFLFFAGRVSKGSGIWKIISVILIVMGGVFLISPITSNLDSPKSSTPSTVYSDNGQSGTTDLQKKREDWQNRANNAYDSGGYWRY